MMKRRFGSLLLAIALHSNPPAAPREEPNSEKGRPVGAALGLCVIRMIDRYGVTTLT